MVAIEMPPPIAPEERVPAAMLLAALEATKTTQSALSRRLGMSTVSVNRWATGKTPISHSRWLSVLSALKLPADWKPIDDEGARPQ